MISGSDDTNVKVWTTEGAKISLNVAKSIVSRQLNPRLRNNDESSESVSN